MSSNESEQEFGQAGAVQDQGAPLTVEEKRLVNRLFSEPLEFPTIFRNWLKLFIESSGIILPKSSIATGIGGGGGSFAGLPAGVIFPLGGSKVPTGSLPCNGMAVSRTEYAGLFKEIGTAWGAGDGSTTFNLPDLRDRSLYGAGSQIGIGHTDGRALGTRGGPFHHHSFDVRTDNGGHHSHNVGVEGVGDHSHYYVETFVASVNMQNAADTPANTAGITGSSVGGGGAHGHNAWTDGQGEHSHGVTGGTSGGGGADFPGFAGVQYVITT